MRKFLVRLCGPPFAVYTFFKLMDSCKGDRRENSRDSRSCEDAYQALDEQTAKLEREQRLRSEERDRFLSERRRLYHKTQFWKKKYNTLREETKHHSTSCPVCFEVFNGKDCQECTLTCGHRFCNDCLNRLSSCPICQKHFTNDQIIKLYWTAFPNQQELYENPYLYL